MIQQLLNDDELIDHLVYLHGRWEDEKEYEDFKDYSDSIEKNVSQYGTFITACHSPVFGFMIKMDGITQCVSLKFEGGYVKLIARGRKL